MRQRLAATIGAIVTIGLFVLTNAKRLADAISLIHLPHDVEEVLTSMSATPILISYGALAVGLSCLTYLIISHWRAPPVSNSTAPILANRRKLPPPLSAVSLNWVLWRVARREWGSRPMEIDRETEKALYKAAEEIRQKAFDGLLPIWARHPHSSLFEGVPSEFWRNHDFEASYNKNHLVSDVCG